MLIPLSEKACLTDVVEVITVNLSSFIRFYVRFI